MTTDGTPWTPGITRTTDPDPWRALTLAEADRLYLEKALALARKDVRDAARNLHRIGESWDSIASALGIHRQTAYDRFHE